MEFRVSVVRPCMSATGKGRFGAGGIAGDEVSQGSASGSSNGDVLGNLERTKLPDF